MRRSRARVSRCAGYAGAVALACALAVLPMEAAGGRVGIGAAPGRWSAADLAELQRRLDAATADAQHAADQVFVATARTAHVRVAMDELAQRRDDAQAALDARAREIYMQQAGQAPALESYLRGFTAPELRIVADGTRASMTVDERLISALTNETAEAKALRIQAERIHRDLAAQAESVYVAQDRARALLAQATQAYAADQAALAALRARAAALDVMSASITIAVAPAVTRRGRAAAAAEEPVIKLLEATPRGAIPAGFRRTGQSVTGESSWYGPGFVGNPTASGSPYDPERFTAAMKMVPLGTVVHVKTADGLSVNLLINDRGPYVGDRIIDVSRAGARELGFTGLKVVTVEVLERA